MVTITEIPNWEERFLFLHILASIWGLSPYPLLIHSPDEWLSHQNLHLHLRLIRDVEFSWSRNATLFTLPPRWKLGLSYSSHFPISIPQPQTAHDWSLLGLASLCWLPCFPLTSQTSQDMTFWNSSSLFSHAKHLAYTLYTMWVLMSDHATTDKFRWLSCSPTSNFHHCLSSQ